MSRAEAEGRIQESGFRCQDSQGRPARVELSAERWFHFCPLPSAEIGNPHRKACARVSVGGEEEIQQRDHEDCLKRNSLYSSREGCDFGPYLTGRVCFAITPSSTNR